MSNELKGQMKTMKAWIQDKYGSPDILELKERDLPTGNDDHVLIRIHAACLNPYDWHILRGDPYLVRMVVKGLRKPRQAFIPGADMAGVVESVGSAVTRFRPGDEVYGEVDAGCFAEYVSAREERIALKPTNLTFEQASGVPMAAMTALQGLRNVGRIDEGHNVLINGAGGGIGTFAVQIAKTFGAEVTGVCSAAKVDLVRSIGADHVIDYAEEDFSRGGQRYDLLLDMVSNHSLSASRRALTSKGTLVIVGGVGGGRLLGPGARVLRGVLLSPFVSQRIKTFVCKPSKDDLEFLKELIEAGKVTPVIDRTYPLSEVPEAIRYLEEGHAQGKVVISVA